jgi:hypothetical protein
MNITCLSLFYKLVIQEVLDTLRGKTTMKMDAMYPIKAIGNLGISHEQEKVITNVLASLSEVSLGCTLGEHAGSISNMMYCTPQLRVCSCYISYLSQNFLPTPCNFIFLSPKKTILVSSLLCSVLGCFPK